MNESNKWAAAGFVDTDLRFWSFLKLYRTDVADSAVQYEVARYRPFGLAFRVMRTTLRKDLPSATPASSIAHSRRSNSVLTAATSAPSSAGVAVNSSCSRSAARTS